MRSRATSSSRPPLSPLRTACSPESARWRAHKLKQRYGDRLEQLYAELAEGHANDLLELRRDGADRPVLETISRAAAALLGAAGSDLRPDAHFSDLGGDSLSALTFANLLHEIFDIDVPVGDHRQPGRPTCRASPTTSTPSGSPGSNRPTFASVHGRDAAEVHAGDVKLDKFIDEKTLAAAPRLCRARAGRCAPCCSPARPASWGASWPWNGWSGWRPVGGTLICLVRAKDDAAAQDRLDKTFDSGDPALLAHYRRAGRRASRGDRR